MGKALLLLMVITLLQHLRAEVEPERESVYPVELSLRWFDQHQDPKGFWDPASYFIHCPDLPKCEPDEVLLEDPRHLVTTAAALICYFGSGYDQSTPSRHQTTCMKSLGYLLSLQRSDGSFSAFNYQNAMVTEALASAFYMSGDASLAGPIQKSVDALLANQNRQQGLSFGWDEAGPTARNDTWVTGWCIMALVKAKSVDIDVHDGLAGARRWLEAAWNAANPRRSTFDPLKDEANFPSVFMSDSGRAESFLPVPGHPEADPAAIGGMCAVFLGHRVGDVMLETLANHIMKRQMPTGAPERSLHPLHGPRRRIRHRRSTSQGMGR